MLVSDSLSLLANFSLSLAQLSPSFFFFSVEIDLSCKNNGVNQFCMITAFYQFLSPENAQSLQILIADQII